MSLLPRYPVYVISKGRHANGLTAKFLIQDGVPFKLVVEPQEADAYAAVFGTERVLTLPFSNLGQGSIPARNWVWEHSKRAGFERHWILDDNIRRMMRLYGMRIGCQSGPAFAAMEDFVDRYENVAIAGCNYSAFVRAKNSDLKPFVLNCHVYSCLLIKNDLTTRWRGRYNEDTDICLQVLSDGWCTVLFNAFMIEKMQTMKMKGGNSTELYRGDGRLKMARSLERVWPYAVKTDRRFHRPQHVVDSAWRKFDTLLKRKPGIDFENLPANEYGMTLKQLRPEIKSQAIVDLVEHFEEKAREGS